MTYRVASRRELRSHKHWVEGQLRGMGYLKYIMKELAEHEPEMSGRRADRLSEALDEWEEVDSLIVDRYCRFLLAERKRILKALNGTRPATVIDARKLPEEDRPILLAFAETLDSRFGTVLEGLQPGKHPRRTL
jgi:hypothetical protein